MDDVGDLEGLVHQRNVTVSKVDRSTGCGSEVMISADSGRDDQVVDDFPIELGNHLIGHEVGEGRFSIDVVNGLEVLGRFQRPRSLELTGNRSD